MTDRPRKGRSRTRPALNPDDERLWRHVTRNVKPLKAEPNRMVEIPEPFSPPRLALKPSRMSRPGPAPAAPSPPPPTPEPLEGPPNRQWARRMSRGDMAVDATLDLHGLTQADAHARLMTFVRTAVARNLRVLLVITGKGGPKTKGSGQESGVLRRSLPLWLKESSLSGQILSVYPAHRRHGGSGAYYVVLRRARP